MVRITREARQAQTRERLIEAAERLFLRDGYAATSVDRIAEEAGFSKGAVYSNFEAKEAIFLTVLERQGDRSLEPLIATIESAADADAVIALLAAWAEERSRSGVWSLTILEHARLAGESASLERQRAILRRHWRQLGACVAARLPELKLPSSKDADANRAGREEVLGALLHEIAYAPALTFMRSITAGEVMRLALAGLVRR